MRLTHPTILPKDAGGRGDLLTFFKISFAAAACARYRKGYLRGVSPSPRGSFLTRSRFWEGMHMQVDHDEFTVYVRNDPGHVLSPEEIEIPLASFSSYEEAVRAQRAYQRPMRECLIRYQGDTGGGD